MPNTNTDAISTMPTASARLSIASRGIAALLIAVHVIVMLYALSRDTGCVELLLVYLAETVIVGILAVPRLLVTALFGERLDTLKQAESAVKRFLATGLVILVSFGICGQIWSLLYLVILAMPSILNDPGFVASPEAMRALGSLPTVLAAVVVIAAIHIASFLADFLGRREFHGASMLRLAAQPLVRTAAIIAVMLIAFVIAVAQSVVARPMAYTLAIATIKISVDLRSHIRQRQNERARAQVTH